MITIYHNIVWSKYKGLVFSALNRIALQKTLKIKFVQIAETENDRNNLGGVDHSFHSYPYQLLFNGSYSSIPVCHIIYKTFCSVWQSDSDMIVLPGYHKIEYWGMLLACILKKKRRAVFCDSTRYDNPQSNMKGLLKRIFFFFCDGFFCYGERSREYLMLHGVNPSLIYTRCQAAALPHNYSLEIALKRRLQNAPIQGNPRFLYVGRLSPEKSIDILLYAFNRVRHLFPTSQLIIVGSGPQLNELKDIVKFLSLDDFVEFTGGMKYEDILPQYYAASCLVLPSSSEPWGLVVNEAMSCGCPVVVSNRCGCIPELLYDEEVGLVFSVGDIDDLVSKLINIVTRFVDVKKTANDCFARVSRYTPDTAAQQIFYGLVNISKEANFR